MDYLWSPWRYAYVSRNEAPAGCIFCVKSAQRNDEENLVLFRGEHNFVLLNLFPYTSGHMMIAPYVHVATLEEAPEDAVVEMMSLARIASRHLREVYRPQGMNLGMNLGECAGAGIAGHIHMHVLPRWLGDANFMTTTGETRVIPEDLSITYEKLRGAFQGA
jgi:ATP adenylyltransferase